MGVRNIIYIYMPHFTNAARHNLKCVRGLNAASSSQTCITGKFSKKIRDNILPEVRSRIANSQMWMCWVWNV